ncbi:hypothetical protein O0L34_g14916 [Tuta absoluta]|nr:hypothetical protein O0L34_g14916 [Tuta absoluta]
MENWLHTAPIPEFHLPDENIYLTSDFDLIPPAQPYVAEARRVDININTTSAKDMYNKVQAAGSRNITLKKEDLMVTVNNFRLDQPNLLRKNRHMELWYRPDFKFRFPTALLYFYFITPLSLKSPREACLLDLWTDVLQQGLKEEVYPANMADLQHSLYVGDKGLTLKVNGYSQNLHLLVDLITREMRTNTNNLTEPLFEAVREERARNYHNLLIKPHKLAKDIRMNILIEPYISPRDKATLVRNITLSELKQFNQRLFTKLYMQTLMQGNIPWYEAIRIAENVFKTISWDSFKPDEYPELQVHQLPLGEKKIRVMSLNPLSTNSIVTNYYQGEVTTPEDTAVLELLTMLMEEPVFDALRTKEQLGYSVYSMMRYTFGVLGFSVTVNTQVDKFSVSHVDARVEAFLKKFSREMTKKLTEKSLSATKKSLIQLKHTTDYELKEEVERNWREILSREYEFQRLFNEANAIAKVFVPHIRAWVDNHFPTGNGSHFRKLSVQIMGHKIDKTTSNVSTATSNVSLSSEELRKHYHLTYLDASQPVGDAAENQADFIKDIPTFVANLPIIEVPRIELVQC